MKQLESDIQNAARNRLAGLYGRALKLLRANVGRAWTGNDIERQGRDVLVKNARPFSTGLPTGFSDTFGGLSVVITPEMVGQTIMQCVFIEFKTAKGATREAQELFIAEMQRAGARAGFARSVEDAERILRG